ncbi:conserved Plasmodium protein, unknown function [Plasmodium ovale]|uniref:Uncharacterized protein n=1 Tax=Plasmodium ovale TaxID=36330 RepID=A0A1C3KPI5_PLAOA|nr:conserved Plasmodium protein, unknown function [Plasmodium ovale]
MAIYDTEDMNAAEIRYSDYSHNSDTTASADTSASEEDVKGIQIKIKRAIENRILDETKKKKKRKLLNFEKNFKKRKNMKIEEAGYKIITRKFKFFKNEEMKKKSEDNAHEESNSNNITNDSNVNKMDADKV